MSSWTRRDFLKFAGVSLAIPFLSPTSPEEHGLGKQIGWGRVTNYSIQSYRDPQPAALAIKTYRRDDVIPIFDHISTEGLSAHNPVWDLTRGGWVYSSWVQPVERASNKPVTFIPSTGIWAEVSVPYTPMYKEPNEQSGQIYRLYYSSVHLIVAHVRDDHGQSWYQIQDDQVPDKLEYVRAESLRPISPDSMSPLSPQVQDKRLEVNLKDQMLYAYENDELVFSSQCATGAAFTIEDEGVVDFRTAPGKYSIIRKRPSRHMLGFTGRPDAYDLPGVPFCSYFTAEGAAVHGAYWHNDFGHPRSHGCVNVPPAVAKWVWRWVQPTASYDKTVLEVKEGGTPIIIT